MPSFFAENNTPAASDSAWKVLQKILGVLYSAWTGDQPLRIATTSAASSFVAGSPNVTATDSVIVAANTNRAGSLVITNTGTNPVYLALGAAAIAGSGIPLLSQGSTAVIDPREWAGNVHAICGAGLASTVATNEGNK